MCLEMDRAGPIQNTPPELVAKVFRYLCVQDRLSARATCRHLRNVSNLPEFWRHRSFIISDTDTDSHSGQPQLDQAKKRISRYMMKTLGVHLHHLTITVSDQDLGRINLDNLGQVLLQIKNISSQIQNLSKTKHLRLQSFNWCGHCGPYRLGSNPRSSCKQREAIMNALLRMLAPQDELSVLGLDGCNLGLVKGVDFILTLASQINASKITSLTIHNLFPAYNDELFEDQDVDSFPKFSDAMGRFRSLERVALNYCYLTNNVLEKLTTTSPSLNRIFLYIDEQYDVGYMLPNTLPDWQLAVKKRPQLQVGLNIEIPYGCCPHEDFILPCIPLVSLSLSRLAMDYISFIEDEIADVTPHIGQHCLRLFVLKLKKPWNRSHAWNRPEALVELLKACPSLTDIYLPMPLTQKTLLQMAAAVDLGAKEGEAGGSSVLHSTSGTPSLHIHMGGCDRDLGMRVSERLHGDDPLGAVRICRGCECKLAFI